MNQKITKETIRQRVEDGFDSQVKLLKELVAIPSISSAPDRGALEHSAVFIAQRLRKLGFEVGIEDAPTEDGQPGAPAVLARRETEPAAPWVLLYSHHDVQPVGNPDLWLSDPLVGTVRGDRLYGRGSADDGGGIVTHLGALAALGDDCPVNVVCYFEGEEEVGSPSFKNFVNKYREQLLSDVIIVADSGNWTSDVPSLTASLRGVVSADVHIRVAKAAVHSGMYSGPVLDAVTLASRLIATLHNDRGEVAVAGLDGGSELVTEVTYGEAEYRRDAGIVEGYQIANPENIANDLWNRASICVIGWDQRPLSAASNTLTPDTTVRLSLRTPPGMDPLTGYRLLEEHLLQNAPLGADIEVNVVEAGSGYQAVDSAARGAYREALKFGYGHESVDIGLGGSIPFISDFAEVFPQAQILVTGIEDPPAAAHAENESMHLPTLKAATISEAVFLASFNS